MGETGAMKQDINETLEKTTKTQASKMSVNQRWLGVFACFTVVWGLLSLINFTISISMNLEHLNANYTPKQVQYLLTTPVWAVAGKAFMTCGLLVGAVYILLRKQTAYYWFMWSLVGTLLVMLDSVLRGGFEILGGMASGVNIASTVIGIFIFWAAYTAVQDGQLTAP